MGHMVESTAVLFKGVCYHVKTTAELREAMTKKIAAIQVLTAGREVRMKRLREEYQIDAERLAVLVMRYQENHNFVSYERQGASEGELLVPAGVIANLVREHDMLDSEREQIWKLELILRNLCDEELYREPRTGEVKTRRSIHALSDNELEYLDF